MSSTVDSKSNQEVVPQPPEKQAPPSILDTQPSSLSRGGRTRPNQTVDQFTQQQQQTQSSSSSEAKGDETIADLHSQSLEYKYDSLLAGGPDPVEVWLPKTRYNAESKRWDKNITIPYLLNTLSAVHKLIPHHLGVTYVAPVTGEIDLAAYNPLNFHSHGQGNRFHVLDNMDHQIHSSAYTNSAKTPQQLNLTRASGGLPTLTRSNALLEAALVNLYTTHPDTIDPSHIDPHHAPFPVESSWITLSNLDIVPVTIHHERTTTKATTPIDPKTHQPAGETHVVEVTEQLPDTIAWARGTSIQRIVNTRNSGMLPNLTPIPHLSKLSPLHITSTNVDASIEPTIVITNPLSFEKITLTGGAKSSPADQLTQDEVNALSDMICIQRNRNMFRGNTYGLAEDIIHSLSSEIINHVRQDLDDQYNAEYKAIGENQKLHQQSLDDAVKKITQEAKDAHNTKQRAIDAALQDMELQAQEAEKRLAAASNEASKAAKGFTEDLKNKIKDLENDLNKLRNDGKQLARQKIPDLDKIEIDFNKAKDRIMQDYGKAMDAIHREWDKLVSQAESSEKDTTTRIDKLTNERQQLDQDFADTRKQIEDLSKHATDLLNSRKAAANEAKDLEDERQNRINEATKDLKKMADNFESTAGAKKNNIDRQKKVVDDLQDEIIVQRDLSEKRIDEAHNVIHGMELEGCWEIPGGVVEVETQVAVVETKYVPVNEEVPTVEEQFHWQTAGDPALKRETRAQTAAREKKEAEERVRREREAQEKAEQQRKNWGQQDPPNQNRGWLGSVAEGARQWFAAQRQAAVVAVTPIAMSPTAEQPSPSLPSSSSSSLFSSHSHIYDFVLNNYDSIIASDTDDDEHGDSFNRWASLTDCDE